MFTPSLKELVKCRWREFRREPSAFFFVIFVPILIMLALGFIFEQRPTQKFRVALLKDSSPLASRISEIMATAERISIVEVQSEQQWLNKLKNRDVQLMMAIKSEHIEYHWDPTAPTASEARLQVDTIVQKGLGRQDAVLVQDRSVQVPGTRYIDFLVPGLLAFSIMTSSLYGTGMTLVVNRRNRLFKRLRATPMRVHEFILSHVIGRGIILAFEGGALLLAAYLIFDFKIEGSFLLFWAFAIIGTACFTALAFLGASKSEDTGFYYGFANLMILPMMLLSGIWFSRESFPDWLAQASAFLPLAPLADGLRMIALDDGGVLDIGRQTVLLALYGFIFGITAKKIFRWE